VKVCIVSPLRSAFRRARGSGPAKCPSGTYSFRRIVRGTANTAMTMTWPVNHGRLPSATPGSWPPSAAVSPVSALSLQRQSETSNVFLESLVVSQGCELELPDQPRPGAAVHRTRSGRAVTRRCGQPGYPERGAHGIVTDLAAAGYAVTQKRRPPQPLPDPGAPPATRTRQPGTRHRRRPGPPSRRRRETAADRYGTSLRAPVARA
jgi:hypothetical protein